MPNSITSRCRLRSFPAGGPHPVSTRRARGKNSLSRPWVTGLNKDSIDGFTPLENLPGEAAARNPARIPGSWRGIPMCWFYRFLVLLRVTALARMGDGSGRWRLFVLGIYLIVCQYYAKSLR